MIRRIVFCLLLLPCLVGAQSFPSKPLRIVVPQAGVGGKIQIP